MPAYRELHYCHCIDRRKRYIHWFMVGVVAHQFDASFLFGSVGILHRQILVSVDHERNHIDIKTLQRAVMRGFSIPNGTIVSSETNGWSAKAADRLPYDPQAAKKLLAEAGYPNGFEFTLDCPNNRYINDEAIGKALAGMWAKIGVKVKVNAIPRANYFPKVLRYDSSVGMVGWGASTQDALFPLQSLVETVDVKKGNGLSNIGRVSDPELDALIEKIKEEENFDKRNELIEQALLRVNKNIYVLPLHTQVINWALKKNIDAPLRADDRLELDKVVVK